MTEALAKIVHEQQTVLADEAQAIAADLRRLRRVRDINGLGLTRQAMTEALRANKRLSALIAAGGLDIRSTSFPQTLRAADSYALRLAALNAVADKYGMRDALARAEAS